MKILSIVETAYRATLEEQDDTILWLNHALKNNGADVSLLLRGNAVNYGVRGQNAAGLSFGDRKLAHAPELNKDLEKLIGAKVPVYIVDEDMRQRGLLQDELIGGVEPVNSKNLPALMDRFDQVWHW